MSIDQTVEELCGKYENGSIPGVCVGVIKDGYVIYSRGFGKANLEYDIPIDEYTVFHCCSIAKQFTAACIALLEEEGKISADQLISDFLHINADIGKKITVKHLINMTNGLFDVYNTANFICGIREDDYFTKAEFWQFINASNRVMFDPGESWSYGNTGYILLAEIIEKVSGFSISEFADKFIFKPLGMTRSFMKDDRTKIIPNRAVGYSDYEHIHYQTDKPYCTRGDKLCINAELMEVPGAGQFWSCMHDLLLWEMNFRDNKLGRKQQAFIDKLVTKGVLNNGTKIRYAYGQFVFEKNGYVHVSHGGSAGGYSCFIDRIPSKGVSVIVLGNHTNIFNEIEVFSGSNSIIDRIMRVILNEKESDHIRTEACSKSTSDCCQTGQAPQGT